MITVDLYLIINNNNSGGVIIRAIIIMIREFRFGLINVIIIAIHLKLKIITHKLT